MHTCGDERKKTNHKVILGISENLSPFGGDGRVGVVYRPGLRVDLKSTVHGGENGGLLKNVGVQHGEAIIKATFAET